MKSIKYTRRHYVEFAKLVSLITTSERREKEIKKLVKMFSADNPRFDEARFRDACNS
jgi:hypothetical protein